MFHRTVGNTMQEDFGFLNVNNCFGDKQTASASNLDLESTKTPNIPTKIKHEDSPDVYKWPFNYGTHFL